MSHFAEIEWDDGSHKKGIVKRVIVAEQNFINSGVVGDSFNWVQTSYNGNFRKNYAGAGFTYDKYRDAFIPPQPFPSWTFNEDTYWWDPPQPLPARDEWKYTWNESSLSWEQTVKRRWTGSLD